MRKTIVLYKSKTGYTKKYAEWIATELEAEISDAGDITPDVLKGFDNIVFGGSLYATGIRGVKKFLSLVESLEGKNIVVLATGLSLKSDEVREEIMKANFKSAAEKQIEFFYYRGGFDFARLPLVDRMLMQLAKSSIERKSKKGTVLTSDEKGMLAVYDHAVDFTNKNNIKGLLEYVRSFE